MFVVGGVVGVYTVQRLVVIKHRVVPALPGIEFVKRWCHCY